MSSISVFGASTQRATSTHGKQLLMELECSIPDVESRIDIILDLIQKDKNCFRYVSPTSGDNALHVILSRAFGDSFVLRVLTSVISICPMAVRMADRDGSLPLHISLMRNRLNRSIVEILVREYPLAASIQNNNGYIPLFLAVMRECEDFDVNYVSPEEDTLFSICKLLCQAYPQGPSVRNVSQSLPLHFASYRYQPNRNVIRMLLRRYSEGARVKNNFGMLPIHCAASKTNDVVALQMLCDAYPEGVQVRDNMGKTCLHLAVLAIGKAHNYAVLKEKEEEERLKESNAGEGLSGKESDCEDYNFEDEDEHDESSNNSNSLHERSENSRDAVRFFIDRWCQALVEHSNFQSTPVETVLEKTKPINSKHKRVSVFGLYDDPPTARLLLLAHRRGARNKLLPAMKPAHLAVLYDLNWHARKILLLACFNGVCNKKSIAVGTINTFLRNMRVYKA
jgi:ankyrin repeat protein